MVPSSRRWHTPRGRTSSLRIYGCSFGGFPTGFGCGSARIGANLLLVEAMQDAPGNTAVTRGDPEGGLGGVLERQGDSTAGSTEVPRRTAHHCRKATEAGEVRIRVLSVSVTGRASRFHLGPAGALDVVADGVEHHEDRAVPQQLPARMTEAPGLHVGELLFLTAPLPGPRLGTCAALVNHQVPAAVPGAFEVVADRSGDARGIVAVGVDRHQTITAERDRLAVLAGQPAAGRGRPRAGVGRPPGDMDVEIGPGGRLVGPEHGHPLAAFGVNSQTYIPVVQEIPRMLGAGKELRPGQTSVPG